MLKLSKIAGSLCAMAVLVGGANVALADGMAKRGAAPAAVPTSWSGFYFGVAGGYQWSSIDVVDPRFPANAVDSDHSDGLVGVHLGLQHQFGAVVLGVEGGWQSSLRIRDGDRVLCAGPNTGLNPTAPGVVSNCHNEFDDVLTVGMRLGWAAGHWMPYLTGGYASGRFEYRARTTAAVVGPPAFPAGTEFERASVRQDGWYIGGGFEWQVSPGWTAGLEYRHYEFSDETTTTFGAGTTGFPQGVAVVPAHFDTSLDTITARVSWRWDIPGRAAARPLK
jgi:opacity protein-like surface antigen